MRFESVFIAAHVLLGCAGGAGQGQHPKDPLSQFAVQVEDLAPSRVAPEIREVLVRPEFSPERLNRLASVVRAQLARARFHFERGNSEAGMRTTMGALFLIRSPEFRKELFAGSEQTLLYAAAHVSRLGDEGRALAFYQLADALVTGPATKKEVTEHLAALESWQTPTEPGSMQAAGARAASAWNLALVKCTRQNMDHARDTSLAWLNRAIVEGRREEPPTTFFEHDERMEARRAVMTSALGVAALYVRDVDATGALDALEKEPLASATSDQLLARLEAAEDGSPDAWADLFGLFQSAGQAQGGVLGAPLAQGAAFGAAIALYRVEPDALRATVPIATLLVDHGMSDAAPLLLRDVVDVESDDRDLVWALRLVFGALNDAEQVGDLEMARRVFENSAPLLALARNRSDGATISPSVSDFYASMGALESRAGELDRARPYLAQSIALAPSRDAYRLLSAIDRQRGDFAAALSSVEGIQSLSQKEGDVVGDARASLLAFELHRDAGRAAEAEAALRRALDRAMAARAAARTGTDIAISETVFAEVLEQYGVFDAAARATERAYDSAQHDLSRLTAALFDASRRALTHWDARGASEVLRHAMQAKLDPDDLIYVALWTQLAQRRQGGSSDGTVEEALMGLESTNAWSQTLKDWAQGAIGDAQLRARARDLVQRTEAEFYVTLASYARGNAPAAAELHRVATSTAIELVEVRIARDLLAREKGVAVPKLPSGVELP
jgi:cellulose synthase operon protein C